MKQKLYIVDPSRHITGAFKAASNEAKTLKDIYDITLVLPSISTIDKKDLEVFDKVIYLPIYSLRKSMKSILLYIPMLFISGWILYRHLKKDKCNLLQINDYYLMQGVVSKLLGFKGKLFTWVRIDPTNYGSIFSKYWLKLGYKFSDKMISVSQFIKSKLPQNDKNILIYDSIDNIVNLDKKDSKIKKIVFVGNYTFGKGQQYAIEVFNNIASKYNDIELHFYGGTLNLDKNQEYKNSLIKKINDYNLQERIFVHTFVENINEVLSSAYIALNFSESESFSLTCYEASASGIPVIATKCGGPEEIIVDEYTGFLVEKANIKQMTQAIERLIIEENLAKVFGENGKNYVLKKFSKEKFSKELLMIFEGLKI